MVSDINKLTGKNKRFADLLKNKDYLEYHDVVIEYRLVEFSQPTMINKLDENIALTYELKKGCATSVAGTYVHKMLINYIAQWADKRYSIKVAHIMNLINDNIKNNKI